MKKVLALVLAALMVLSLAACGGNANGDETTAKVKVININLTDEEYAFGVDKDQPELLEKVDAFIEKITSDGTFDEICNRYAKDGEPVLVKSAEEDSSKDQLLVATNAEFQPFEYKSGDSYVGIDMEVAKLLAEELGKELVIKDMAFDSVCLAVGQHKCDIAMAGLTVSEDRKDSVNFSTTYYKASQQLIVKADDTKFDSCKTKEDVEEVLNSFDSSVKIGFQNGTTADKYVKGDGKDYKGLAVEAKGYDNGALAVQDMVNGGVDYVMIDASPAASISAAINAA